jgi:hypothetical protein
MVSEKCQNCVRMVATLADGLIGRGMEVRARGRESSRCIT